MLEFHKSPNKFQYFQQLFSLCTYQHLHIGHFKPFGLHLLGQPFAQTFSVYQYPYLCICIFPFVSVKVSVRAQLSLAVRPSRSTTTAVYVPSLLLMMSIIYMNFYLLFLFGLTFSKVPMFQKDNERLNRTLYVHRARRETWVRPPGSESRKCKSEKTKPRKTNVPTPKNKK